MWRYPREITYLKEAVIKTGRHRPAILLADRFVELGNYEDAIGPYDLVMRSRQVDIFIRVTAGMLADITTFRYSNHSDDAKIFWRYVESEFDEFKFFSLQAKFLNGSLSEKEFRLRVGDSPDWKASAEYAIGLNHWLNGDPVSAVQAFERCLQVDIEIKSHNRLSPQKWAR